MSLGTLKGWLKSPVLDPAGLPHAATLPGDVPARQWGPQQRLLALNESHRLSGPELHAWCREKGLFEHQLVQWRAAFCAAAQPAPAIAAEQRQANAALRELQGRHDYLYLFIDIFSRKIVGWQVFDCESAEQAAALLEDICRRQGISP